MTTRRPAMSEEEIRKLAQESAKAAVKETLLALGVDAENPLEVQKDMQHLREWRQSVSTIKKQGLITAVGIVTAGILGAIWLYIKGA